MGKRSVLPAKVSGLDGRSRGCGGRWVQFVSVLTTLPPLLTLIVGKTRLIGRHVVTEGSKQCG